MELQVSLFGQNYTVQQPGYDISIPMHFNGAQPNTYGVPPATSAAYEQDGWVGDVRRGGSCNFETYVLTPHCNGTHTECVGHIAEERIRIREVLAAELVVASLVSVTPVAPADTQDRYTPALGAEDRVIDRASLEAALVGIPVGLLDGLVLRTLPNAPGKCSRDYMQVPPAFFTLEAMTFLSGLPIRHLLVDLPSVDRLFDEGKLSAHHIFWGVPQGTHAGHAAIKERTITEMIFVPDAVPDGCYLLDLQIAPFMADAAPSRPVLFALT